MAENETKKGAEFRRGVRTPALLIILALAVLAIVVGLGYVYSWSWVGVVDYEDADDITLWKWLDLLFVPLLLAAAAVVLTERANTSREEVAQKQRAVERVVAAKRLNETRLQSYFDRLERMLDEEALLESRHDDVVREFARARTLVMLSVLDGEHKGMLL
jgi:hypothetical protein